MSSVEEQLGRDIAAVTGGVVVTEPELKEAREAVEDRIEIGRQRSRRRRVASLVAAAVVLPIVGVAIARSVGDEESLRPVGPVGPTPSVITAPAEQWLTGEPPTQDLVQGVWREDNGHMSIRFSPSGTVQFDELGQLFGKPGYEGTYEITGDLISIDVDGGDVGCVGARFAMRASLPKPGLMRFVPTASGTGKCTFSQIGVWGAWEQVLPAGPPFRHLMFGPMLPWQSWPDRDSLMGMWAAEGGGYVLEMDRSGSYYVADETGETVDRGRWAYRRSQLTLTSSAGSVACSKGDRTQLDDLEYVDPGEGTVAMQWTMRTNSCGGGWATKEWFRVPSLWG
jgi:hypothetical protein